MIAPEDFGRFVEIVSGARRVVLMTHMNADGDALGSEIGMASFLASRGVEVEIVNPDPVPPVLRFLDTGGFPFHAFDAGGHERRLDDADLLILLDNSAPDRLGALEAAASARADKVLCVDHHPTRGTIWGETILDPEASATAAMVHELTTATGWEPDADAASSLYVGLATDTGFFRFNSTNSRALRIAAELVDAGARPAVAFERIHERNSTLYTRLLGDALADLQVDASGRVASIRLTRAMLGRAGDCEIDSSEMTTPLLAIEGVRVAILFRELQDDRVKVSLRSKGRVDVYRLALEFGGGGHRNASGIVAKGTLDDVVERVLGRVSDAVDATP